LIFTCLAAIRLTRLTTLACLSLAFPFSLRSRREKTTSHSACPPTKRGFTAALERRLTATTRAPWDWMSLRGPRGTCKRRKARWFKQVLQTAIAQLPHSGCRIVVLGQI